MAEHYGPGWQHWMPGAVAAEHWRRFPFGFGSGPEALFLNWMNMNFGLNWQSWVPTQVVFQSWCRVCNR